MDNSEILREALIHMISGGDLSQAIEKQEKQEQEKAVANHRLPKTTNESSVPRKYKPLVEEDNLGFTKKQYESMGIKIIEEYDDLFYSVILPVGWQIRATSHSMWNKVLDDKGRVRISFFYKGAFYDRHAFSNFERRFSYKILPFDNFESEATYEERLLKPWSVCITDGGKVINILAETEPNKEFDSYEDYKMLDEIGKKYISIHYPEWEDINSYWDKEFIGGRNNE